MIGDLREGGPSRRRRPGRSSASSAQTPFRVIVAVFPRRSRAAKQVAFQPLVKGIGKLLAGQQLQALDQMGGVQRFGENGPRGEPVADPGRTRYGAPTAALAEGSGIRNGSMAYRTIGPIFAIVSSESQFVLGVCEASQVFQKSLLNSADVRP
jgi:hypothetical protein